MPRYGFNFQWMYVCKPGAEPKPADERALDFMVDQGLDFVRLPTDYRFWTTGADYLHPDERMWAHLDGYLEACRSRSIHFCLNLHRAPGYCINRIEEEPHRLWHDGEARDGFVGQWEMLARRYEGIPSEALSFDLVNEPNGTDEERPAHEAVIRRTVDAIRAIDPQREIVIDGWKAGGGALPELADLDVIHSTRGYHPGRLTHHRASWTALADATETPTWPMDLDGQRCDRDALRQFYQPWLDVEGQGRTIHVGEFGCYNRTPNDVALAWYADVLSLFGQFGWGYSLWNFAGPFGIVEHGREGAQYETIGGLKVDRALLELYLANRVSERAS